MPSLVIKALFGFKRACREANLHNVAAAQAFRDFSTPSRLGTPSSESVQSPRPRIPANRTSPCVVNWRPAEEVPPSLADLTAQALADGFMGCGPLSRESAARKGTQKPLHLRRDSRRSASRSTASWAHPEKPHVPGFKEVVGQRRASVRTAMKAFESCGGSATPSTQGICSPESASQRNGSHRGLSAASELCRRVLN